MKLLLTIALSLSVSNVGAFSPMRPMTSTTRSVTFSGMSEPSSSALRAMYFAEEKEEEKQKEESKTESNDGEVASMAGSKESDVESMTGTIYDRLGFTEDQIALGINPEQVSTLLRLEIGFLLGLKFR